MAKIMKAKLVKKSARKAPPNERKEKSATKAAHTASAEERIVADAADPTHPEIAAFYEAVLGIARPVSQALSSDVSAVEACSASINAQLRRAFREGGEYAVEVTRIGTAPLENVRFDISEARKAATLYSKAGVDVVAGLRLCPAIDPEIGACMALDQIAIIGGRDAKIKLDDAFMRSRKRDAYRRSPAVWSPIGRRALMRDSLTALFRPPWHRLPEGDPFYDPDLVFSDDWDPGRRALMTLMSRSQLPLRNMLVGFGAGKPIVSAAIGSVEHLLKGRCRAGPEIVHRDEIAHRWFDELRRRGLDDISVPVLLLH